MLQTIVIGIGAGAAAALLFASVASGSVFAIVLSYLAPLPILIAALGWSHWAAVIAALCGAGALATTLESYYGGAFLIGVGAPAWWLGYLALLARPGADAAGIEWYPPGRLLLWAAVIGALVVVAAIPNFGNDRESFQSALRAAFERALRAQTPAGGPNVLDRPEMGRFLDLFVQAIPPAAAVLMTLINVINLWLAARIVRISGQLRRPWPNLAASALPAMAPTLLVAVVVASLLPDLAGLIAGVFAAALLIAFALIGFAVMHTITRGMNHRRLALAATYASVALIGWPVLGLSLLGLADSAFHIRARTAATRGPPGPPT